MIINTGQRTDIPAFFSRWFANRLMEGIVCVRNPYDRSRVSRYRLDPSVVDCIAFCTKDPEPMFPYMDLLTGYGQLWHVSITGYGRDIEPNVPDKHRTLENFRRLSRIVGKDSVVWRYDPILINGRYTAEYHLRAFRSMAEELEGFTSTVVISFIDLYAKVRRNFPEAEEVPPGTRLSLGRELIAIAAGHGMTVRPCAEGNGLARYGADCGGCLRISDYEKAIGRRLNVPAYRGAGEGCSCYIACDIGAYDTCRHLCRYCYANSDRDAVMRNGLLHDPDSPFLIGGYEEGDRARDVPQESWIDIQESLL